MKIEFAGIVWNDDAADSNGIYWYVEDMEGWDDSDVRSNTLDPTNRPGNIVANAVLQPLALGLTCLMKAPNVDAFWAAHNALMDTTGPMIFDPEPFIVHEGSTRRQVNVVRVAKTRWKFAGVCAARYDLSLSAPDPIKVLV